MVGCKMQFKVIFCHVLLSEMYISIQYQYIEPKIIRYNMTKNMYNRRELVLPFNITGLYFWTSLLIFSFRNIDCKLFDTFHGRQIKRFDDNVLVSGVLDYFLAREYS